MLFWNVIDQNRQFVLKTILDSPPIESAYLAGGTALALILGHRESIDFDWFSPEPFTPEQIERNLSEKGELVISEAKTNTFHGMLNGVRITWLYYPRPLLEPLIVSKTPPLSIASIPDIGTMKLIAASQRGARKDFIDLYFIAQYGGIPLTSLIRRLPEKFPDTSLNYYHIVKSLIYFDDAEKEPMPRMLKNVEWDTVKKYFIHIQKQLLDSLP